MLRDWEENRTLLSPQKYPVGMYMTKKKKKNTVQQKQHNGIHEGKKAYYG